MAVKRIKPAYFLGTNINDPKVLGSKVDEIILAVNDITVPVNGTTPITGALAVSGAITSASITTTGAVLGKVSVTTTDDAVYATPVVLTTADSGKKIVVSNAAGVDFTLPAISTAYVGTVIEFFVTVSVTSNNFRVTSATGDLMTGSLLLLDDTVAYTAPQGVVVKPATSFLVMTMNGTTKGGKIGTRVRFTATTENQWFVEGVANGSGILATPFS